MRAIVRLLLAVFVVGFALQCQDRQNPTEVDSTGLETASAESDINNLLGDIFDGRNESASKSQASNIFRQYGRGRIADAQTKAIALVDFILDRQAEGHTTGTDEQVNEVLNLILTYVGFDVDYEGGEDTAIEVCGAEGCEVVTENEHAGVDVPAGAFSQQVVIIIERLPDFPPTFGLSPAATSFYPLPSGFDQYPVFYDITTIPEGMELNPGFLADVGLCVLEESDGWEQGAPDDVLADLVLAHPATDGPGSGNCDDDIDCLPVVNVAGLIDCSEFESGPVATGFRGLLDNFTKTMVSPFSPSLLYASPGDLGGQASSFSPFAAVDPTSGFADGFEDGLAWTATGFWNRTDGAGIVNAAVPTYVNLAPDDASGGALPAAAEGTWYVWYGAPAEGNYIGTQIAEGPGSGGTSTGPNSGSITSPEFRVPNSLSNPALTFDAWFEIESVNTASFDVMTVSVIDVDAETVTVLGQLNPPSDPGGSAPTPFSSSGFNLAPSFATQSFPLSGFNGRRIQIVFSFNTVDHLYNGFRGWIVDDVQVVEGLFLSGLAPASTTTTSLSANRAACGEPVCPGFPQRENR